MARDHLFLPADNAPSSPHQCNGAIVQFPSVTFGSLTEKHEPLGIRHNLGSIKSLRVGETERGTDRIRDRQRNRGRERERDKQTEGQKERQKKREREGERQEERWRKRQRQSPDRETEPR